MSATVVGTVSDLRRYPVKSMLGEQLDRAPLTEKGVAGDRAYALVDEETGKVVSVKRPKRWGRMFELTAQTDSDTVRVSFPDGATLAIDEAWAGELKEGAPPYLGMGTEVIDGEEFIDGGAFMRAQGNFFDFGALHLVTTASTRQLAQHAPESSFDPHRFRPNIVVETPDTGFVETTWQGRTLTIGDIQLSVGINVPRCVMTTLAQDDLPADRTVLRTISRHNSVDFLGTGTPYPCLGVYADVATPGEIAVGDTVTID